MTTPPEVTFEPTETLKRDLFGVIDRGVAIVDGSRIPATRRHLSKAPLPLRPIARMLASREARAMLRLEGVDGVPWILARRRAYHLRTWIDGSPIDRAPPADPEYYAEALRLLRRIHRAGVTHNDTHKEPNWLVREDGSPALLDFQLATRHRRRSRWFRLCALEDIRHLLKHKKKYCPHALTPTQRAILKRRSWPARYWRRFGKPIYRWFTRRVLKWRDDEGRGMLDQPPSKSGD